MVYIRQQHLANLKNYKYAGVDHSPISRFVLKPFYNKFVINCFPMSMACVYLLLPLASGSAMCWWSFGSSDISAMWLT